MSINKWPVTERPRERLLRLGAPQLTDAELLAILIRTGGKGKNAVDLARKLLNQFNGLRGIFSSNLSEFCAIPHLGTAKYCELQSAAELGKRYLKESMPHRLSIKNNQEAENFIIAQLRDCQQEVFAALFLDTKHRVIQFEYLFSGSINSAGVYPREIIKKALYHNAAAMIVAHNHPSGIAEPSLADQDFTIYLKKALAMIEVILIDHLIIGDNHAVSLAARGLL